MELGGAIQRTTGALQQSITNIEDAVSAAVQNGRVELGSLLAAIQSSSFNDYLSAFTRAKNKAGADLPATVRAFVDDIRQRPGVSFLRELPFDEMDAIRSEVNFTGADLADFYILASIVRDRAKAPDRAAVFCSLDRREFKNKASADFYDRRRITFRPNFDFRTGIGAWQNDFASPSK